MIIIFTFFVGASAMMNLIDTHCLLAQPLFPNSACNITLVNLPYSQSWTSDKVYFILIPGAGIWTVLSNQSIASSNTVIGSGICMWPEPSQSESILDCYLKQGKGCILFLKDWHCEVVSLKLLGIIMTAGPSQ